MHEFTVPFFFRKPCDTGSLLELLLLTVRGPDSTNPSPLYAPIFRSPQISPLVLVLVLVLF